LDVHIQLWDWDGNETHVSQTQDGEEKYMRIWSWGSEPMARMISRFPNRETSYMHTNSSKTIACSSASSERPRRWNSETGVKLCASKFLGHF
jgi:uncharacterized protein (DUF3084 family)